MQHDLKHAQKDHYKEEGTYELGFERMVIWVNPSAPQLHWTEREKKKEKESQHWIEVE